MSSEQRVRPRCIGEDDQGKPCRRLARNSGALATRIEGFAGQRLYCERCLVACVDEETQAMEMRRV